MPALNTGDEKSYGYDEKMSYTNNGWVRSEAYQDLSREGGAPPYIEKHG